MRDARRSSVTRDVKTRTMRPTCARAGLAAVTAAPPPANRAGQGRGNHSKREPFRIWSDSGSPDRAPYNVDQALEIHALYYTNPSGSSASSEAAASTIIGDGNAHSFITSLYCASGASGSIPSSSSN